MALSVASGRFAHDFFKCAAHSITVGETAFVSNLSNREAGVDKKVCCCVRSYINKILSESEACKSLKFLGKARFTHIKKFGSSSHSYVIVIILDNIFNNLPNVGKSTLFNCLSSAKAQAANFPFCTIDAQMGQVSVPDERLTKLAELVHPGRIVPAVCDIVDIAGLVKGASKGEGLGNQFLGNIRECDAIIHVLRCFDNGNIVHVDGSVNPVRDKEIIDTELQLKDLETVENRIKRVEKIAKVGGDKAAKIEYELLLRYKDALEQGQSARTVIPQNDDEEQCAKQMFLLTTKPVLYVCNVDDVSAAGGNQYVEQVREAIKGEDAELIIISAQTEADIAELETYEEKQMFLEDLGLKESGCNRLIKAIYSLLNLETFITAGEMEVKAWTYRKGWKAPQCAGVIHTDFEKGFIRAEVIKYEDYIKYGSEAAVREAGKLGVEGKEYVVQDGDIMHFRFNV